MFTVSPIKSTFNFVKGYNVCKIERDYSKTVKHTFEVNSEMSVEAAYETASDLATLLNISEIVV